MFGLIVYAKLFWTVDLPSLVWSPCQARISNTLIKIYFMYYYVKYILWFGLTFIAPLS
jgi:hypothetical protein